MKKPNISLLNLSEIRNSGVFLAVRKGINELVNRESSISLSASPVSSEIYEDLVSVIICTANRENILNECVLSLLNQNYDRNFEIIIVNNSKTPLNTDFTDSVMVVNEPSPGLSRARNIGAKSAHGEFLIYIDDDAVADKELVSQLYKSFIHRKKYAIIGGQIFLELPNPPPEILLEGKEALWSAYTVPYKKFREVREQYEFPYGACFGIRHSFLDSAGGFPEDYGRCGNDFAGGEETALCFMAKKLGYKIGINPSASVHHYVLPERFSAEHVRKTVRESIITTYRLFRDGYAPSGWNLSYVKERINIIEKELKKLTGNELYYKQCEYDAFIELKEIMN